MNAQDLLTLMKERRSYRQFEDKQITDEELNMILEAGLYAPNAGSRQSALFLVTQDKDVNLKLGMINKNIGNFKPGRHVNPAQPSIIDDSTIKNAFYDAPTVITILTPKGFLYSELDAGVAGENMLLMAHALGLGGCMIGRAYKTLESEFGQKLLKEKGIPDNYCGYCHIIIGYPKGKTFVKNRKERVFR